MATEEEQELMAQINRLEGRINRHKAQQVVPSNQYPHHSSRGTFRTAPYTRGGYRGSRAHAPTYRNKTLVLNGQTRPNAPADGNGNDASWVSRTDRHLQLINTNVFKKDSQARASAMEQTQQQKRRQKEQLEKMRFLSFVQQNASTVTPTPTNPAATASTHEIMVEGIRFQVTKQGSKLVRAPGDNNSPSATPRVTTIGGVKFYRTKNGNLIRHGIAKAQRMAGGIKKVNEPCKAFSWTGIVFSSIHSNRQSIIWCGKKYCSMDTNLCSGSCPKGPRCRFIHDPSKVAICRDRLFKNECPNGDSCDLSHEVTEQRTPLCLHFANGKCNNDSCPYVHAEHSQADPVCRNFGIYGYCERGAKCPDRHVFECPDFSNTGVCKTAGCKLLHRERASVLRNKADHDEEMPDFSSDEEGASDDIDSDEVEEFIGHDDDVDALDFSKDYIGF